MLPVVIRPQLKAKPTDDKTLGFGKIFTDYMMTVKYTEGKGWHDAKIEPYAPIEMELSSMVLHYGQTIFEGLKAYIDPEGKARLFRPWDNLKRLNNSCDRLCIPRIDEKAALKGLEQLVMLEKAWIPRSPGTSLYIRPTIIATDEFVGVHSSKTYLFFIILSPVGAYYAEGLKPVKIWVEDEYVRAVRGGMGEAKTAGNYAASLLAGEIAEKRGYTQVLWLDGVHRRYVEEVGSMNICFVIGDELVTPELDGSVLHGITRDSVLKLAAKMGIKTSERRIAIDEIFEANESGDLKEVFGTGTAAVISPVGELKWKDKHIVINNGEMGKMSEMLYNELTGIQYGLKEDPFGWIDRLE